VKPNDEKVHDLFIKAQAEDSIAEDDIACTSRPSCPLHFLLHRYKGATTTTWHPMIQISCRVSVKSGV
jgi:hypothetical protein